MGPICQVKKKFFQDYKILESCVQVLSQTLAHGIKTIKLNKETEEDNKQRILNVD